MVFSGAIDLSRPRDRRFSSPFVISSLLFIMLAAVGSYNGLQFHGIRNVLRANLYGVMKRNDHPRPRAARPRDLRGLPCGSGVGWFVR